VTLPAAIGPDVLHHLARFVGEEPDALVFTVPSGRPIWRGNFNALVKWSAAVAAVGKHRDRGFAGFGNRGNPLLLGGEHRRGNFLSAELRTHQPQCEQTQPAESAKQCHFVNLAS
jgi:hypothetical protein